MKNVPTSAASGTTAIASHAALKPIRSMNTPMIGSLAAAQNVPPTAAIEGLIRLRDKRAIPVLQRHIDDPWLGVANYVRTAVRSLES